jgi:predicted unusual protein kinase regulating ubiquinone biosynthesis (AarF/ABC1/UbiB family)
MLADGTKVVVKVQRPGIRQQMKADIGVMGSFPTSWNAARSMPAISTCRA